jgi:hypothetical protein
MMLLKEQVYLPMVNYLFKGSPYHFVLTYENRGLKKEASSTPGEEK